MPYDLPQHMLMRVFTYQVHVLTPTQKKSILILDRNYRQVQCGSYLVSALSTYLSLSCTVTWEIREKINQVRLSGAFLLL